MSLLHNNRNVTGRASEPNFENRRHYIFEVPFDELTDDSIVCTCCQIKYSDVKRELEFGIETVDELLESLEAGNSCRKCVKYLEMLLEHAREELEMA